MYGHWCQRWKNNIDNLLIEECELCYECVNIKNWFESYFCTNSNNIYNCYYCDDCSNISYSIWSVWKKHWKYIILNECFDEKYYLYFLKKLKTDKSFYSDFLKKYKILKDNFIKKYFNWINNINFIWDYVQNCNNSFYSFNNRDCKDIKFCFDSWQEKFCYDLTETLDDEKSYEVQWSAYWNWLLFVSQTWHNSKVLYSQLVFYSNNCFWCVWLKNKEYCILNKQYTKEEYEELVPKIIKHIQKTGEWWEFFPSSISPFWYNETTAQEYYPLSKKESQDYLFNWSNYETPFPKVSKIIPADKLPDNISDIPDDILNWAIECEITKKPFRIIKQELEFYRKHNLPIPKRHPDQRHLDRMALRNPRKLFDRKCDKCSVDMKTTYSPDREELVYCEECYNKEIY